MAKNAVRECGSPAHTVVKNGATAKSAGQIISFGPAGALAPIAVLLKDAAINETDVPAVVSGEIFRYTCVSADTANIGDLVYFDVANDRCTTTAGTNNRAGRCAKAKANGETTIDFILNGP